MRSLLVLSCAVVVAACGDLDVESVRSPGGVAAAWEGEWVGSWQSAGEGGTGDVVVRVQTFRDEPIVRVEFDNPCFEPRTYELVLQPTVIQLQADGVTVLAATLDDGPQMLGTFQCDGDSGTWQALRVGDLPEVFDLGGQWAGALTVPAASLPIALDLQQSVEAGTVVLSGILDLGDGWPLPIGIEGRAEFRDGAFDVVLRTPSGSLPDLVLSGIGETGPLRIETGLLQALGPPVLPWSQGVFTIERDG